MMIHRRFHTRWLGALVVAGGLLLSATPARAQTGAIWADVPAQVRAGARYVIYLHGRIVEEKDPQAVAREVREELGVEVEVGAVLDDVPADPPDGTYTRWRTYACRLIGGEPVACGNDGGAQFTAVRWLPLADRDEWGAALRGDPFLYPQLERIRAGLGLAGRRS